MRPDLARDTPCRWQRSCPPDPRSLGRGGKLTAGAAEFAFARDALGRETKRSGKAFVLDQRFDAAGQLTGQSSGRGNANMIMTAPLRRFGLTLALGRNQTRL